MNLENFINVKMRSPKKLQSHKIKHSIYGLVLSEIESVTVHLVLV